MEVDFGKSLYCKSETEFIYPDGLVVSISSRGHKRPYVGGPTKGWIVFYLLKNEEAIELTLYVTGVEGDPSKTKYGQEIWQNYRIALLPEGEFKVDLVR